MQSLAQHCQVTGFSVDLAASRYHVRYSSESEKIECRVCVYNVFLCVYACTAAAAAAAVGEYIYIKGKDSTARRDTYAECADDDGFHEAVDRN